MNPSLSSGGGHLLPFFVPLIFLRTLTTTSHFLSSFILDSRTAPRFPSLSPLSHIGVTVLMEGCRKIDGIPGPCQLPTQLSYPQQQGKSKRPRKYRIVRSPRSVDARYWGFGWFPQGRMTPKAAWSNGYWRKQLEVQHRWQLD